MFISNLSVQLQQFKSGAIQIANQGNCTKENGDIEKVSRQRRHILYLLYYLLKWLLGNFLK